jgi:ribosomal protein S7
MIKRKKNTRIKIYHKLIFKADPFYQSYWFAKFMNKFMLDGKKYVVEKIINETFLYLKKKWGVKPLPVFLGVIIKFRPLLDLSLKRQGKQIKKIPGPLLPRRQAIVSLKWLTMAIKLNRAQTLRLRMRSEFSDLSENKKTALWKRSMDHLRDLEINRLNHRFRWK